MTDLELLELAAKADGHEYPWYVARDGQMHEWNPLADDGDALRLAVKLGIQPVPADDRCEARWWGGPLGTTQGSVSVITNSDRYTATRRAIVLAAAEIGKAVQKPLAP